MLEIIILLGIIIIITLQVAGQGGIAGILNARNVSNRKIILDSCALIDGRIIELVKTGFVQSTFIIPKFILKELQLLADGNDSHKRERARFGLEIAVQLQEIAQVTIDDSDYSLPATDDKLIILAKEKNALLCTTDYNLNKVATVESVKVLNVNELSHSLRPVLLPGEQQVIKLVQKGSGQGQAVGYLEDGTMVVVDNAQKYIGKSVRVEIDHMLQTVAGKMAFAKLKSAASTTEKPNESRAQIARRPGGNSAVKSQPTLQKKASQTQQPLHQRLAIKGQPRSRDQLERSLIRRTNNEIK